MAPYVFGNKVTRSRVQTSGQEAAGDQVVECVPAKVLGDHYVKGDLAGQVERVDVRERQLEDRHRSEGIKQDLEGAEERLAQDRIEKEGLKLGWQVGIETIDTE